MWWSMGEIIRYFSHLLLIFPYNIIFLLFKFRRSTVEKMEEQELGGAMAVAPIPAVSRTVRAVVFVIGLLMLLSPQFWRDQASSMVTILVANSSIARGEELRPASLSTAAVPEAYIHPFQIPLADKYLLDGRTVRYALRQGQPLLWSDLQEQALTTNSLSTHIPVGYRAVSLSLEGLDAFGGLIEPGDTVDLWWRGGREPKLLLASVPVAALDDRLPGDDAPKRPRVATFALPEKEAAMLLRLREKKQIGFMLRNPTDVTDVTHGQAMAELTRGPKPKRKPEVKKSNLTIVRGR